MTKTQVIELIRANILALLPGVDPGAVRAEASMRNLGANSIDRADILIKTLADLRLKVSLVEFAAAKDIGGVADVFCAHLDSRVAA